jgi:cytochrome c-type biogenesis protein CcsB
MKALKLLSQSLLSILVVGMFGGSAEASIADALRHLPVQDGGRIKPFDTFARESLQLVYGKRTYHGKPAVEVVFTWMLVPEHWNQQEFVLVNQKSIKEDLKLDVTKKYFSPAEISKSDRFPLMMQDLQSRRAAQEKLDPHFQAAQTLEAQLGFLRTMAMGQAARFVPPPTGDLWLSLPEASKEVQEKFAQLSRLFVENIQQQSADKNGDHSKSADSQREEFARTAAAEFMAAAKASHPELYPSEQIINLEIFYNDLEPFMWAWVLYILSAIFLTMAWSGRRRWALWAMWTTMLMGFFMHNLGFALRVYIAGRAPVSNMYETVVWVAWGAIFFGMVMELIFRRRYILLAAQLVGALCLIVADLAPAVLDPSLQPLQPVLRSNFWLTVHVLTVTVSYASFFLAFMLGDFGLILSLLGREENKARLREIANSIYRTMQIGVVLLAAGIILGGIWADYSWGRFWGWDPKETWSFIALMGYLAVLHGRLAGLLGDFGLIVASVIAFSLILMSWYGVNFVLGAGLHSYGFGAGGVEWVTGFVVIHFFFVAIAVARWRGKGKAAS